MSDGRKYRLVDAAPGSYVEGVLVTAAQVVMAEIDGDGLHSHSIDELRSIAAKLDRVGYAVTDAKRDRAKAKRRRQGNNRVIHVGHLTAWEGLGKVRVTLTGDAKKVRVEIQRGSE